MKPAGLFHKSLTDTVQEATWLFVLPGAQAAVNGNTGDMGGVVPDLDPEASGAGVYIVGYTGHAFIYIIYICAHPVHVVWRGTANKAGVCHKVSQHRVHMHARTY